jgi:uncharacterized protein DUF1236
MLRLATEPLSLSAEQQVIVGDIITNENSEARPAPNWPVAIDGLVPENVNLRPLPTTAENVAPELKGLDYLIVEEEIALVNPKTRRIVAVLPRWRTQTPRIAGVCHDMSLLNRQQVGSGQ